MFHSLRHFAASSLLAEGAPLTAVAGHLGDTVETVSRVYVHWLDATKAPPPDELRRLTDDQVYECVRWWAQKNYASIGMQLWLDELSRRATDRLVAANLAQINELLEITRLNSEQTNEMAALTRDMKRYAVIGIVVAIVAVVVAVVSFVVSVG